MPNVPDRIDAYHFYEDDWESYDELEEAFEWVVPDRFNVAHYVCDRWAATEPDRTGLRIAHPDGGADDLTYGELDQTAGRLANAFAARGVGRGDRIVVHGSQRRETIVAFVAAWKLGAIAVPVSTLLGPDGLGYRLVDCEAAAMVADAEALDAVREAERPDTLDTVFVAGSSSPAANARLGEVALREEEASFRSAVEGQRPGFDTVETGPDDTSSVIYTSGTTGQPKGVLLPHRVVLGHLPVFVGTACNLELREDDLIWSPVEWTWVASLFVRLLPSLYYGVAHLAYDRGTFEPAEAFDLVDRHEVTILGAAPTALRMMAGADASPYDLESVRVVVGGGESFGAGLRAWARETFGDVAIHEGYGQTEANGLVHGCEALFEHRSGKIGRAGIGHAVRIVDPETLEPLPPGEVGEFAVRVEGDPVVSTGYLNRPGAMEEKRRGGWHFTGDLGTVDADGYFAFEGRKDQVIVSSGYRMGPEEIEEQLTSHEAVAAAGVIGVPDETRGEVPKAFVVLADGFQASEDLRGELQSFVRERLAKYEYPRELDFIDDLPTTTSGKIRRATLEELEAGDS